MYFEDAQKELERLSRREKAIVDALIAIREILPFMG